MTLLFRPSRLPRGRAFATGPIVLLAALASQTAPAASIGEVTALPLGAVPQDAGRGDLLQFVPLGGESMPQRRARASRAEIARLVDSLDMPRPELASNGDWMPALEAATTAVDVDVPGAAVGTDRPRDPASASGAGTKKSVT